GLLLFSLQTWAQQTPGGPLREVKGTVRNMSTGELLQQVNVTNLRSGQSVLTGRQGAFSIPAAIGDSIAVSHVGFQRDVVVVRNFTDLNFRLEQGATQGLEDVVVVAYGTIKKSDLTGSVVALKEKDFNQGPVTSVEDLIQGKAAGVNIVQHTGEPGGGM